MMYKIKGVLWVFLLTFAINSNAQSSIGIKYFGLSIHPKGEKDNAFLMPNKFDDNGVFVMNFGAVISYETFLNEHLSLKTAQALYADCAARLGGFTHLGFRAVFVHCGKHTLSGGIGPTLVYRRNWLELPGYKNQNRFKGSESAKWQYLFIPYGGEFEYKYSIDELTVLAVSFVPGYPDLMSLSFGISRKLPLGRKVLEKG